VTLKDMTTGAQERVAMAIAVERLAEGV
jgi:hypothetical protein